MIQNPPSIPGIFIPATIRNGFGKTVKNVAKWFTNNGDMAEGAKHYALC